VTLRGERTAITHDAPGAADGPGRPGHAHDHDPDAAERWAEHATASVRRAGHRAGGARQAVIDSLADQSCCRSAQEIFDQLRADDRRVGIASVYRVLDLLVSLGLVQRLDLGGGISRFEPALPGGEHHHHLVCVGCGEVLPFEDPALEAAIEAAAHRSDFTVEGHDVVLRGRCARCRDA
jgi:Fur family ferric uptake transcriptional regulator